MQWAPVPVASIWRSQAFQAGALKFAEVLKDASSFPQITFAVRAFPGTAARLYCSGHPETTVSPNAPEGIIYNLIL